MKIKRNKKYDDITVFPTFVNYYKKKKLKKSRGIGGVFKY